MAGELDSLIIRLAAETADAQRQLARVERQVGKFSSNTNKQLANSDKAFARLGMAAEQMGQRIAAALAVGTLVNYTDQLIRATNSMADLADTTGFTYREFQELQTLMLDQGMGLEKLDPLARGFAVRMGELRGQAGGFYEFLNRHLPTLRDQLLATQSQAEALAVLETAFERLKNPAERSALANQAFGESGLQLAAILSQQGSQLERGAQVAREYGTVIEDDIIAQTRELQRQVDLLSRSWNKFFLELELGALKLISTRKGVAEWLSFFTAPAKLLGLDMGEKVDLSGVFKVDPPALKGSLMPEIAKATKDLPPLEFKPVIKPNTWKTTVEKGDPLAEFYKDAIAAQEAYEREVKDSFAGIARTIETALSQPLADAFAGNIRSAKEYFQQLSSGLAQAIYQATILKPLMEGLTNAMSGGGTTSLGSLFGGLFGGFKASGGPVKSGVPYIVGERGPELMVPRHAGTIVPNHALGGGGSQVVYNIDARGAAPGVEQRIMAALAQAEKQRPPAPQQMAAYGNRFPLRAAA